MNRGTYLRWTPIALLPLVVGCAPSLKAQATGLRSSAVASPTQIAAQLEPAVPAPVVEQSPAVEDPVLTLIAVSDNHFKAGQTELEQGHFEAAKLEFNRAVDVLLESPYGARTESRIRDHFDRMVDR